jgi:membrane-associated phospholipid phosphatase
LLRNVGGLVARDNAAPFLVGGGLTAVSFALDDEVRTELSGSDLGGLQSFGDTVGDATVVAPLTGGLFVVGRFSGNQRFRDMTYDLAQAQIVTLAIGHAAKRLVGRERPNGSNRHSFPSGHSFGWFSIATVVERHYGIGAALPAFGIWALTSLSRVANDTHHFSDVIGGAALGYLVARTAARVNSDALPAQAEAAAAAARHRPQVQVWPSFPRDGRGFGVQLAVAF